MAYIVVDAAGTFRAGPYETQDSADSARSILQAEKRGETFRVVQQD